MKAIAILLLFLELVNCKNEKNNSISLGVANETRVIESSKKSFLKLDSLKIFDLLFGPKELITTPFPRNTVIVFDYNMDKRPWIEEPLNSINEYFQIFNLWSAEDSTRIKSYQKEKLYISNSDTYSYYDIPLISKMVKSERDTSLYYCRPFDYFVQSGKLETKKNYELFFYTTFPKYYRKNLQSSDCENYVGSTDIIIQSKDGEILDAMNLYYYTIEAYDTVEKYSYINDDLIITQYNFVGGETYQFIRKEKWQIKANGKLVRYYENDGAFKNTEEHGLVKNTMREGKWVEIKPNGIVDKQTYLEADYEEGEPIGEWKLYSFKNNKKGGLLYSETYRNGKFLKRLFVQY